MKRTEGLLSEELLTARDMIAQLEQINAELHQYFGAEYLLLRAETLTTLFVPHRGLGKLMLRVRVEANTHDYRRTATRRWATYRSTS